MWKPTDSFSEHIVHFNFSLIIITYYSYGACLWSLLLNNFWAWYFRFAHSHVSLWWSATLFLYDTPMIIYIFVFFLCGFSTVLSFQPCRGSTDKDRQICMSALVRLEYSSGIITHIRNTTPHGEYYLRVPMGDLLKHAENAGLGGLITAHFTSPTPESIEFFRYI